MRPPIPDGGEGRIRWIGLCLACGPGGALRLRLGLLEVELAEVDRLEQQRRETAVAHRIRHHAAGEREQQARRLAEHERLQLVFRNVAHAEQPGIDQLDDECGLVFGLRLHLDLERDLVDVVADAIRDGGFPPLLLEPIDFNALFLQQAQAQGVSFGGEVGQA